MKGRAAVDDRAASLALFENGATGTLEAAFEDGQRCWAVVDAVERRAGDGLRPKPTNRRRIGVAKPEVPALRANEALGVSR